MKELAPYTQGSDADYEISQLARSVMTSISYDKNLQDLSEETLTAAIADCKNTLNHVVVMKVIRAKHEEIKEREHRELAKIANIMAVWKLAINAWDCFKSKGNVLCLRPISVKMLAEWFASDEKFLSADELKWCKDCAMKQLSKQTEPEKGPFLDEIYNENCILFVMNKFKETEKQDPNKFQAFIENKRNECNYYSLSTFNYKPNWDIETQRKVPYTSALGQDNNNSSKC